ncbi:hypothetical protein ACED25_22400 [Vibrio sp. 1F263]|uniref:hypothetical protein n=1 Tax=Vibrio sp. 1F263 TaxID=3230012 RepID=UPI00352C8B87
MRIIGLLLVLALTAASFMIDRNVLAGTRWHCKTIKTGFMTQAFQPYQSLYERMTFTFQSDNTFMIAEAVKIEEKNGQVSKLEHHSSGRYSLEDGELSISIIDYSPTTETDDPVINRDYSSYKGLNIDYSVVVTDDSLYLFNKNRFEIFNWVCFKVQK